MYWTKDYFIRGGMKITIVDQKQLKTQIFNYFYWNYERTKSTSSIMVTYTIDKRKKIHFIIIKI